MHDEASGSSVKAFARPSLPVSLKPLKEDIEQQQQPESIGHVSSFPYTEPAWSNLPKISYNFQVLKNGVQCEQVHIPSNKTYLLLGRVPLCDLQMDHPSISRFHAILQFGNPEKSFHDENDQIERNNLTEQVTSQEGTSSGLSFTSSDVYLYDVKSVHGTFVNKRQLEPYVYTKIQFGDFIRFGASSRIYILHAENLAIEEAYYDSIAQKRDSVPRLSLKRAPEIEPSAVLKVSNHSKVLTDFLIEAFGLEKANFVLSGQQHVSLEIHPKDHLPENLSDILLLQEVVSSRGSDGFQEAKNLLSSKILNIIHESGFDPSGVIEKKGRYIGKEQRAAEKAQEEDEYYDRTNIVKKAKFPELRNSTEIYESLKGLLLARAWQVSDLIGLAIPQESECSNLKVWTEWLESVNAEIATVGACLKEKVASEISEINLLSIQWESLEAKNAELQKANAAVTVPKIAPVAPSIPVPSFRISIPGREKKMAAKGGLPSSPLASSTSLPLREENEPSNSENDSVTDSIDWLPPS